MPTSVSRARGRRAPRPRRRGRQPPPRAGGVCLRPGLLQRLLLPTPRATAGERRKLRLSYVPWRPVPLGTIRSLKSYLPKMMKTKQILRIAKEMKSADLIREARLRAAQPHSQLADLPRRDRTVIARWEHGTVA